MQQPTLNAIQIVAELVLWSGLLVSVHAWRGRIGMQPFYVLLGGMFAWLQVMGHLVVYVELPGGLSIPYASIVYFPSLLVGVLLVYALQPDPAATWRLLGGFALLGVAYAGFRVAGEMAILRGVPRDEVPVWIAEPWVRNVFASTGAIIADVLVVAIVYQCASNLLRRRQPWMRGGAAVTAAVLGGLVCDGVVYPLLAGFELQFLVPHLAGKFLAGLVVGAVVGPYVAWEFRSSPPPRAERRVFFLFQLYRELERAEQEIARGEVRYRELLDALPDGALITRGHACLYANHTAARICGASVAELLESNITSIFDPGAESWTGASYSADSDSTADGSATSVFRTSVRRPGGRKREVEAHVRGIAYQGEFAYLSLLRDVTRHRRDEDARDQAVRLEALGAIAGRVAHVFNNELGTITGFAHLARGQIHEGADPQLAEYLDNVLEGAERGKQYASRLLGIAQRSDLETRLLDVPGILDDMRLFLEKTFGREIKIEVQCDPDLPPLRGVEAHLREALVQMAGNAHEAMPAGGLLRVAARRLARSEWPVGLPGGAAPPPSPSGDVLLEISDEGQGIPPDEIARVFDPSFTTKERSDGSGLGLATVVSFVRSQRGRVAVSSEVGVGTTIRLYLPGAQDTAEPRASASENAPVQPPATAAAGRSGTVLYVDDERGLRALAQRVLEPAGYTVATAADGPAALAMWDEAGPFDVIILDLVMPGMSGQEAFSELRKRGGPTRVLFTSGFAGGGDSPDPAADSDAAFLAKPFTPRELLAAVDRLLGGA